MKKYYSKREIKKWNDEGAVLLFDIFTVNRLRFYDHNIFVMVIKISLIRNTASKLLKLQ